MKDIIAQFELEGRPVAVIPFGDGHINETYLVATGRPHLYILQKVNRKVFPDARGLMNNIIAVTEHLRAKDPDPRHSLTLVPTRDGQKYLLTEAGELWRVYEYIMVSICLTRAETAGDFRGSGKAFGKFLQDLGDFDAGLLVETIPHFHDTPHRYRDFHAAVAADVCGRAKQVKREIDFFLEREASASVLMDQLSAGVLPLRVTQNDTKLNNVMLDEKTREPLCVLDLDTVMPGLAANDFGDAIRFGASTAEEDERDLSLVHFSLELYRAYAEGYLSVCRDSLGDAELLSLADGSRILTLECGMRFLTDYLQGDTYFHVARREHNLDRARTQIALVAEMEGQMEAMKAILWEMKKA